MKPIYEAPYTTNQDYIKTFRTERGLMDSDKIKVLIVDDQIFNIVILEEMILDFEDTEVITASNGKEAVDKFT